MRSDFIDISGKIYGYWTVLSYSHLHDETSYFNCKCKCGTERKVSRPSLVSGASKSCGCYNIETKTKHGKCKSNIYKLWAGMKNRCNSNNKHIKPNYKDRGITICKEWLDFLTFEQWAKKNGYSADLEIDRIDNNKGYMPENCRFVTCEENANNKRTNHYISYNGVTKTMKQWSVYYVIPYSLLQARLRRGWTMEKAISTSHIKPNNYYHPGASIAGAIVD